MTAKKDRRTRTSQGPQHVLHGKFRPHLSAHLLAHHFEHIKAFHADREAALRKSKKKVDQGLPAHTLLAQLRVYTGLAAQLAQSGMRDVDRGGWVLLVELAGGLKGQVEVEQRRGQHVISRLITGAMADELARAVELARRPKARKQKTRSQLRILSVPSMQLFSVWLHRPKTPAKDAFIPVTASFLGLHAGRKYARNTVERAVGGLARKLLRRQVERKGSVVFPPQAV